MAVLFALDRAGARDEIGHLQRRLRRGDPRPLRGVQRRLQRRAAAPGRRRRRRRPGCASSSTSGYELPAADWQVLLDVPAELAAERAEHRASTEADRAKDAYERDDGLQRRTGEVYCRRWRPPTGAGAWLVAGPDVDAAALATELGQ